MIGKLQEILRVFLHLDTSLALAKNASGYLPLHRLILHTPVFEALEDDPMPSFDILIQACPQALEIPDNQGDLPLHLASELQSAAEMLSILDRFPAAAAQPNLSGIVPIQRSFLNRKSVEQYSVDALERLHQATKHGLKFKTTLTRLNFVIAPGLSGFWRKMRLHVFACFRLTSC